MSPAEPYPENPVLCRVYRAGEVESVHRGAWCLTDTDGNVLAGQGGFEAAFFARSAVKALQAVPLIESGAAERFAFDDAQLALAIASHSGAPEHTETVARMLAALGLEERHLQCGAHPPMDGKARRELVRRGEKPTQLHNNCSGKHAGFLALALHLGVDPAHYLRPESESQLMVRAAVSAITGVAPDTLVHGIDGCSAPTFRMPLARLATAFARIASPEGLAPAHRDAFRRMARAAAAHPTLIAGERERLCTDLLKATHGRLFPKIGAEAVYAIGVAGAQRGLAIKIDDGGSRALGPVVVHLLSRFRLVKPDELQQLAAWRDAPLLNHAKHEVGRTEVVADA